MLTHYLNVYKGCVFGWRYYGPPTMLDIYSTDEIANFEANNLSLSLQPHIHFIYETVYYPSGTFDYFYFMPCRRL